MLRGALLLTLLIQSIGRPSSAGSEVLPLPLGLAAYIVSPFQGRWLFSATVVRFEAVLVHYGVTTLEQVFDTSLTVDGQEFLQARMYMPKIRETDECLDPERVLWRSGCRESDFSANLPAQALTLGVCV